MLLAAGCTMSAERYYVRKAVKLMDRHALFAQGSAWEEARSEAMAADPFPHRRRILQRPHRPGRVDR